MDPQVAQLPGVTEPADLSGRSTLDADPVSEFFTIKSVVVGAHGQATQEEVDIILELCRLAEDDGCPSADKKRRVYECWVYCGRPRSGTIPTGAWDEFKKSTLYKSMDQPLHE